MNRALRPGTESIVTNKLLLELSQCESLLSLCDESSRIRNQMKLATMRGIIVTIGTFFSSTSASAMKEDTVVKVLDPSKLTTSMKSLGNGTFGSVFEGDLDGTPVAVKVVRRDNEREREKFVAEATTDTVIVLPTCSFGNV